MSSRAHHPVTVDSLVASWRRFVGEVERGYEDTIDDYTNDLTGRDLLEEALAPAPAALRISLRDDIQPLDERFERATQPDESAMLAAFVQVGPGWWWKRLPVKLVGALAASLSAST